MASKMLREIVEDDLTPKKSDKIDNSNDFYERFRDPDDGFDNEI